jgi:hypothetical protein
VYGGPERSDSLWINEDRMQIEFRQEELLEKRVFEPPQGHLDITDTLFIFISLFAARKRDT